MNNVFPKWNNSKSICLTFSQVRIVRFRDFWKGANLVFVVSLDWRVGDRYVLLVSSILGFNALTFHSRLSVSQCVVHLELLGLRYGWLRYVGWIKAPKNHVHSLRTFTSQWECERTSVWASLDWLQPWLLFTEVDSKTGHIHLVLP